jgi:hypothetical protein
MSVELFSNLLWLAISSLLIGFWLRHRNRWTDDSLRSGIVLQLIALALLIVVLLPVVSITDDLQACAMPAESEHLSRRSDLQTIADLSLHSFTALVAVIIPFSVPQRTQILARLSLPARSQSPCTGYLCIMGIRPPPAV